MQRVLLLNGLLSVPWTRSYWTSDSDDHDEGSDGSSPSDDSGSGARWAHSSWRMQGSSGENSPGVGCD